MPKYWKKYRNTRPDPLLVLRELNFLADDLALASLQSSEAVRNAAKMVESTFSAGATAKNIGVPAIAGGLFGLSGSISVGVYRGMNILSLVSQAVVAAANGISVNKGHGYFRISGSISRAGASSRLLGMKTSVDVRMLRLLVNSFLMGDVSGSYSMFEVVGQRLAFYGNFTGTIGLRGTASSGNGSAYGSLSMNFQTYSGASRTWIAGEGYLSGRF